ncbi:MAG: hypothetical protein U5L96_21180 [Owenweeksia sp.]|nr:hypothetical protein [Owenweeksia sp.]
MSVDYEGRNALEMLIFGLRYATSRKYRKQVEHRADAYAIDHGMAKLILATKKFILEHSDLSESYKSRIRQYYMSEENVRLRLQEAGFEDIQPDDANILDPDP